jgi:hypothetical protein
MNNGIVIIANNSEEIDYVSMSYISAQLAKKNLKVPVSLITDPQSFELGIKTKLKQFENLFDKIIIEEKLISDNFRNINNKGNKKTVPFYNEGRSRIFDLTPYDRTLLIDSDFLIFSDNLAKYWNIDQSVLISPTMSTVDGDKGGVLDIVVSPQSIPLYWATTILFTKNEESEYYFNLIDHIRQNYNFYSQLYQFSSRQYRNDISFSISYHILRGFDQTDDYFLPPIKTLSDKDEIYSFSDDVLKIFLFDELSQEHNRMIKLRDTDIHFMNKLELLEKMDLFL